MKYSNKQQLARAGYVLIPDVLTTQEAIAIRARCEKNHSDGSTHMSSTKFLAHPELAEVPFKKKIIEAIESCLGKAFSTIEYYMVQANCHDGTWHTDAQSQGNFEYLYDEAYQVYKCGIYLQENSPEWGGGLDVLPGSHLPSSFGVRFPLSRKNKRGQISRIQKELLDARNRRIAPFTIQSGPRDLLIFHACLLHRASPPRGKMMEGSQIQNVPLDKKKYLLSWEVAAQNDYLPIYLAHQRIRGETQGGVFADSMNVRYPERYPQNCVQLIEAQKLSLGNVGASNPHFNIGHHLQVNGREVIFRDPRL